MINVRTSVWRRGIGVACASLGLILFAGTCFIYLRYAADPSNLHVQERLLNAPLLGLIWNSSFYGSMILFVLSMFSLGWGRWAGLVSNASAFLCALMVMGAMCGPFGC